MCARGLLCPLVARYNTVHNGTASVAGYHWSVHSGALSKPHVLIVNRHRVHHLTVGVHLSVRVVVLDLFDWCAEILF
jgi:hypothetical protein